MSASEDLYFDGHQVAHIVTWYERLRLERIRRRWRARPARQLADANRRYHAILQGDD